MSDPEIERIMRRKMEEFLQQRNNPIIEVNENNFRSIVSADRPVLADFWAEWCTPCKYMHPIFDKLARRYAGKIIFAKVNVDTNQSLATNYEVYAIPTFMILINGKSVERLVGVASEDDLIKLINKYI